MKETVKRNRLDLYDKVFNLREEFSKIYRTLGEDTSNWFRALCSYIALKEISERVEYITIKWLKKILEAHTKILNCIKIS